MGGCYPNLHGSNIGVREGAINIQPPDAYPPKNQQKNFNSPPNKAKKLVKLSLPPKKFGKKSVRLPISPADNVRGGKNSLGDGGVGGGKHQS